MKYTSFLNSFIFVAIVFVFSGKTAFSYTVPTFPSCLSPQGSIKVNYSSGTHGVPGDARTYTGSDVVYYLTDSSLTQCLCTTDGHGIQTNWWKASSLTEREKNLLISQGWIYIPDGAAWGLSDSSYLAKNTTYSCVGGAGGTNATAQKMGDVLGLASTGNVAAVLFYATSGIMFLSLGFYLKSLHSQRRISG